MQERLGVLLEKEDEMDCLVSGSNFLLKAIRHEAFMYENSQTIFAPSNSAPRLAFVALAPIILAEVYSITFLQTWDVVLHLVVLKRHCMHH